MNKKIVIGIVAGVGAIGTVAGIVHRNNKKVRQASRLASEAIDLVERSMEVVDEAIELLKRDSDYDFLEDDYDDEDFDDEFYEEGDEEYDD